MKRRFLASETYGIPINACITVKAVGGISDDVMTENWENLKDTFAFLSFVVC